MSNPLVQISRNLSEFFIRKIRQFLTPSERTRTSYKYGPKDRQDRGREQNINLPCRNIRLILRRRGGRYLDTKTRERVTGPIRFDVRLAGRVRHEVIGKAGLRYPTWNKTFLLYRQFAQILRTGRNEQQIHANIANCLSVCSSLLLLLPFINVAGITLFNCRGRGFEICFSIYVPVLNFIVEDEEDEKS